MIHYNFMMLEPIDEDFNSEEDNRIQNIHYKRNKKSQITLQNEI